MTEIVLYANGQRLETQTEPLVVAKSRNEYTAAFTFSDDWKKITKKTAVFRRYADGQSFTVDLDSDGKCKVPWEVLDPPRFHVSAFGGNLRTMTETYINVEKTGYDENAVPSATVPQIHPTPTDLQLLNDNLHLVAGNEKIGSGVSLPTIPTNLKLTNNLLQLYAGENPIGAGVEIRKTPTLLDTFTIADGGDPIEFYQLSLTNQNWRKILISGTVQSTDTDAINRRLAIGTSSGFVYLNFQNTFNRKKYFTVDAECMANGGFRAHCTLSLYQYTDSQGGTYENVGRNSTTPATRIPTVYMRILESQFAPGTSFEVWGVE